MSLNLYIRRRDVPVPLEDLNDLFFDSTLLENDDFTKLVLKRVDRCEFVSESSVFSDVFKLQVPVSMLSVECKTILNVHYNQDLCFNVVECGNEALLCLFKLTDGNVYCRYPVVCVADDEDDKCDIMCLGMHFVSLMDMVEYLTHLENEWGDPNAV